MFDLPIIDAIKDDAKLRFPEESCGVVVRSDSGTINYHAMPNVAEDPLSSFHVDEHLLVPIIDKIVAIVHSHPNGPNCPSKTDMEQQLAWRVPFGIVATDGEGCLEPFFWGGNAPVEPLVGRGFRHGVADCYALVRDYYRETCGVMLNEYPRDWEWWTQGETLYSTFFEPEGFFKINESDVREHDGFIAQVNSPTPNHAGVYVGKSQILHHITSRRAWDPSRLSRREPIGSWAKFICGFWVRHRSLA